NVVRVRDIEHVEIPLQTIAPVREDLANANVELVRLLGVAALVLLVACANIANLLLARATTRHHELSVRIALGASRWRLVRLLLVESFLLAVVGSAAGLLVARWSSRLLVTHSRMHDH